MTQLGSNKLEYDFRFPTGRWISADGALTEPRTAVISMCSEAKHAEPDVTVVGVSCTHWPERRDAVLSLLALGYSKIEQDCFDDICQARMLISPSDLGITSDEIAAWAEHWPEYIGRGPVP